MTTQDETQTPDNEHTTGESSHSADPQGPVPALCPPEGGHSPTRPSTPAVGVEDSEGGSEARPRNWYEAKQDAKRTRLEEASRRAKAEAGALSSRARTMADVIPLGQPILVGHHSEKRDRPYRARISRTFERAHEAAQKAQALAARAENVGTGGVSSDDPEAVLKLREKLAALENALTQGG